MIGLAGQYAAVDENLTGRENLRMVGRLTHLPDGHHRRSGPTSCSSSSTSTDAADRPVQHLLGWHAAPPRPRRRARAPPAGAVPRRADHRARPAQPQDLWGVIEELVADGTTVLLTTQYLEEADRLADHIVVIDNGEVIAEGTAAELKATLGATIVEVGFADNAHRDAGQLVADSSGRRDGRRRRIARGQGRRGRRGRDRRGPRLDAPRSSPYASSCANRRSTTCS